MIMHGIHVSVLAANILGGIYTLFGRLVPLFGLIFGKVLMFVHAKARSRQHAHLDMMTMVMTMGRGDKLETRTLGSERVLNYRVARAVPVFAVVVA